jgi:predicted phage-related endonuclease
MIMSHPLATMTEAYKQRKNMKIIPKPTHGSQEWLLNRWKDDNGKCTFGASEAPALMGVSPYTSRAQLFVSKMSEPEPSDQDNPVFRRGHILEPALLTEASRLLGVNIVTPHVQYRKGRFTVSKDGVDDETSPNVGVEAKTTTKYSISSADDLPAEWLYQGWAQQWVLGVPIYFVVLDRNMTISMVELPDNRSAIEAMLEQAELLGGLIDRKAQPEWDLDEFNAEDIALVFKQEPTSVELPAEAIHFVHVLEEARAAKKEAEKNESSAKDALARFLQGNEIGVVEGRPVISWKEYKGRESVDVKALQASYPELCAEFTKQGAPYRVMKSLIKNK